MGAHERPATEGLRDQTRPQLVLDELIERALAIDPADRFASGHELGAALRRAGAGVPLPPPPGGHRPSPPPPTTPPPPPPTRTPPPPAPTIEQPPRQPTAETAPVVVRDDSDGPSSKTLIGGLVAVAFVVAAVVAALLLLGGGDDSSSSSADDGGSTTPATGGSTTPVTDDPGGNNGGANAGGGANGSQQSPSEARKEIVALLGDYQTAYSNEDIDGLGATLAEDVKRVGVNGPETCGITEGKAETLGAYSTQFAANGASTYTLTDLAPDEIKVSGAGASSNLTYSVGASSGAIAFGFSRDGDEWLINDINANC